MIIDLRLVTGIIILAGSIFGLHFFIDYMIFRKNKQQNRQEIKE